MQTRRIPAVCVRAAAFEGSGVFFGRAAEYETICENPMHCRKRYFDRHRKTV